MAPLAGIAIGEPFQIAGEVPLNRDKIMKFLAIEMIAGWTIVLWAVEGAAPQENDRKQGEEKAEAHGGLLGMNRRGKA
jgi:hypothetical protein